MNAWSFFPEPTPVRSISPEDSARVWAAKGLLLGEDRPDDDRCSGCDAASCEPCRQQWTPEPGVAAPEARGAGVTPSAPAPGYRQAS